MVRYIIFLTLTFAFLPLVKGWATCGKTDPLFKIERSQNKNIVQYDACLLPNDNVSDSNPVNVYWILANGDKQALSVFENRFAYGIGSEKKLGTNRFRIFLAALKNRSIIIEKLDGDYRAVTQIDGQAGILEKVYVKTEEQMVGVPKVDYIELFGRSLVTHEQVQERIIPG